MCRLVGVGVTQMNGTKWSNIRTQLESPHKRRNQDADECQRAGVRHPVRSQILRFRILDGKMRYIRMPGCVFVKDRILAPFMIQELFPSLIETASGSHPCRVVSVTYRKLRPFHRGNRFKSRRGRTRFRVVPRVFRRTGSFERFSACAWEGANHLDDNERASVSTGVCRVKAVCDCERSR